MATTIGTSTSGGPAEEAIKRVWTLCALAVAVVLALAWFVAIHPRLSHRSDAHAQVIALRSQIQQQSAEAASLSNDSKTLAANTKAANLLTKKFPGNYQQGEWLAELTKVAKDNGVAITSVSPAAPVAVSGAAGVTGDVAVSQVTITANGDRPPLLAFLKGLGAMPRPFLVTSESLTVGSDATSTLSVTGEIVMVRAMPSAQATLQPGAASSAPAAGAAIGGSDPAAAASSAASAGTTMTAHPQATQ